MSAESAEQKAVLRRQFHLTEVPMKVCTMETFYKNKVPTLIPFMQFRFNSDTPAFVQAACVRNQGDTRTIQYIIKGLLTHEETFSKKNGARTVIEIKQDAKKTVEKKGDGAIVRMTEELKNQVINAEVVERKQNAVEWQKGAVELQKGAVEWQKGAVELQKGAVEWQKGAVEKVKEAVLKEVVLKNMVVEEVLVEEEVVVKQGVGWIRDEGMDEINLNDDIDVTEKHEEKEEEAKVDFGCFMCFSNCFGKIVRLFK